MAVIAADKLAVYVPAVLLDPVIGVNCITNDLVHRFCIHGIIDAFHEISPNITALYKVIRVAWEYTNANNREKETDACETSEESMGIRGSVVVMFVADNSANPKENR